MTCEPMRTRTSLGRHSHGRCTLQVRDAGGGRACLPFGELSQHTAVETVHRALLRNVDLDGLGGFLRPQ